MLFLSLFTCVVYRVVQYNVTSVTIYLFTDVYDNIVHIATLKQFKGVNNKVIICIIY